jgi:predicted metalloprotease with PDZ domain
MKRNLPTPAAALLLALTMGAAANILPAGRDTEDIMVGVTGMTVALKGGKLLVTQVTPDTPAEGKLEKDDTLLSVDGASLAIQDPRHPLGFAINAAEGRDGRMTFDIQRAGTARKVVIQLAPIGSYSQSYPVDCPKSRRIVD